MHTARVGRQPHLTYSVAWTRSLTRSGWAFNTVEYWVPQGITTTADATAEAGYDGVRAIVVGWYYDQGGTERGVQLSFVDYSTPGAATCSADFADTPPYSSRSRACHHGREM